MTVRCSIRQLATHNMFQVTAKSAKSTVLCARRFATNAAPSRKRVVFVDGCRIPFQPAGTIYDDFMSHDLGRHAIKGLLTRTAIDSKALDYVIMGTVIQEGLSRISVS